GAPIGSMIAGSTKFIDEARKWRKRLGGGLRQAGVIAAPGVVALKTMVERLAEDHKNAKQLASKLEGLHGLAIENQVETNIVLVNTKNTSLTAEVLLRHLRKQVVVCRGYGHYTVRFTTHFDVTSNEINQAVEKINQVL